jgi:hypothetical protein
MNREESPDTEGNKWCGHRDQTQHNGEGSEESETMQKSPHLDDGFQLEPEVSTYIFVKVLAFIGHTVHYFTTSKTTLCR